MERAFAVWCWPVASELVTKARTATDLSRISGRPRSSRAWSCDSTSLPHIVLLFILCIILLDTTRSIRHGIRFSSLSTIDLASATLLPVRFEQTYGLHRHANVSVGDVASHRACGLSINMREPQRIGKSDSTPLSDTYCPCCSSREAITTPHDVFVSAFRYGILRLQRLFYDHSS
jgi:hypothetical protein